MIILFYITSVLISLSMPNVSWSEEPSPPPLTIKDMKVESKSRSSPPMVLISCRVEHTRGLKSIEGAAATVFHGQLITVYPNLYDDGTHGDKQLQDGVYSLEITAPDTGGEATVVFHAMDTDRNEIESDPVAIKIE